MWPDIAHATTCHQCIVEANNVGYSLWLNGNLGHGIVQMCVALHFNNVCKLCLAPHVCQTRNGHDVDAFAPHLCITQFLDQAAIKEPMCRYVPTSNNGPLQCHTSFGTAMVDSVLTWSESVWAVLRQR